MEKPRVLATYTYGELFKQNERDLVVFGSWSDWSDHTKWRENSN